MFTLRLVSSECVHPKVGVAGTAECPLRYYHIPLSTTVVSGALGGSADYYMVFITMVRNTVNKCRDTPTCHYKSDAIQ